MTTTPSTELYARVQLNQIVPSLTNPRKTFDAGQLAELAESIRASGVHQPVLLRPLPAHRVADTASMDPRPAYELVVGERRYRASEMAGAPTIPAVVRAITDDEALEIQVIENLQRDDLQPLEEAEGYQSLMQRHDPAMTVDQVAERIGKSRSYVYARLKLLALCPEGRQALMQGKLDASRALLIARIPDSKLQAQALGNAFDYADTPLSYRNLSDLLQRQYTLRLAEATFKITDATLLPDAGSCKTCPKRTGADPDLFTGMGADICTDPPCFKRKQQAHADAQFKAARESGATIIEGREAKAIMPSSWDTRVEGYLRLDDAKDSPTDKPLRKLIGKQLEQAGIQPTLVANPHKEGELVAVVDHETARQMLAAKGLGEEARQVEIKGGEAKKADEQAAKKKATEKYEAEWRLRLMARTWEAIGKLDETAMVINDQVMRHLAMSQVNNINQDRAKRLCKLLDLGKVAPVEAVKDWVREHPDPERALALVLMNNEVEHQHWLGFDVQNKALLLLAEDHGVDVEAVKAEVKKEHTAALRAAAKKAKEAAENTASADAPKGSLPLPSAAQAKGGRGGAKPKNAPPAARAKKPRTSEREARSGIAAAMQGNEVGPDAGPEGTDLAGSAGDEEEQRATPPAEPGQQGEGDQVLDSAGQPITVGCRVMIVGDQFTGQEATVQSIQHGNIFVKLPGMSSDFVFQAEELAASGFPTLKPVAAWPFPPKAAA